MTDLFDNANPEDDSEFLFYQAEGGQTRVQVRLLNETVWLSQRLLADLFEKKVRLIVLPSEAREPFPNMPEEERPSTGASLLQYAGTWTGDDLEQRLQEVYATRSKAQF